MEKAIRILYVEDVPNDAVLVLHEISKSDIHFTHTLVETKKDYVEALISIIPDIIISDYCLPQFDGMNALSLRNEIAPQTPFILVTGPVNEVVAVECMKAGADDYILKSDLTRLIPSIRTAIKKREATLLNLGNELEFSKPNLPRKKNNKNPGQKRKENSKYEENEIKEYELNEKKQILLDMAMESAGIGIWFFDLNKGKGFFDNKASELLGFLLTKEKRTENDFLNCIHPHDRKAVKKLLSISAKKKSDFETDFRVIWPDGTVKFLTARAKIIINEKGIPIRLDGLTWDITDQKLLQITLQENLRKTNSIINNLNGAVFRCKFDQELTMEYISEGVKEQLGFPSSDFLMNRVRSFASLIYTEDKVRVMKTIEEAIKKMESFTVEYRITTADGSIKWIWEKGRGIFAGNEIKALEGFFSDISDRKKVEEELKNSLEELRQLTHYIEKVREEERVAISRELHDDLGQALTAVKIDLANIKKNISDMDTILKISKVSELVGETIKTVQKLTSQLRPQIIDDLGLEAAIEWYTNEFAQRNKVAVFLDLDSGITISPEASLSIFRIMQESLTNVARHSGASEVEVILKKTGDTINLIISDNGTGIKENEMRSKKSFGIISMKERAVSLGGTFDIYREENCKTIIKLIIPLIRIESYENSDL